MRKPVFLLALLFLLTLVSPLAATSSPRDQANLPDVTSDPFPTQTIDNLPTLDQANILATWEGENSWPTLAANNERTSWTPEEVSGNLKPLWYLPIEPYISQRVQIIAAYDTLYIATAKGLYTLNADTGAKGWVYPTELPLGHSPTVQDGVVYVGGLDRKIHAIDAFDGDGLWTYEAEAGFVTNPLVADGKVFAGSRDGYFYALNASNGHLIWRYKTDGPITYSAAYKDGVVYFASNDSYAYALNGQTGALVWKSSKLPGAGFQSWWPVIYENRVIFSGSNNYRTSIQPGGGFQFVELERDDVYPNHATDPRGTLIGGLGTAAGDWAPGTVTVNASRIYQYFNNKPWRQSVFVLNRNNGQSAETAPVLWTGTHSNSRYPPVIGADGVLYQQNNYMSDPYIAGGQISGWQPGVNYISVISSDWAAVDEPHGYSAGGDLIYWNLCCDRQIGAIDITVPNSVFADRYSDGIRPPTGGVDSSREWIYFGYNLDTIIPNYNQLYHLSDTKSYASFGSDLGANGAASGNGDYGYHGDTNAPIPYNGKIYVHRGNSIIAFTNTTAPPQELSMFATVSVQDESSSFGAAYLNELLETEIEEIVAAGHLRPAYTTHGIFDLRSRHDCGDNLTDYWSNPGETLVILLEALPYLSPSLQQSVRTYLQSEFTNYPPYQYNHIGWSGAAREIFDVPPEANISGNLNPQNKNFTYKNSGGWEGVGVWGRNPYAFYALWKYAEAFGNAGTILNNADDAFWEEFNDRPADSLLTKMPHVHNAYIAGMWGFLELQSLAGVSPSSQVQNELNRLLNLRVNTFTKDSAYAPYGRDNTVKAYCRTLNIANNFMFMVPELAAHLRTHKLNAVQTAVSDYETLAPNWFVTLNTDGFAENAVNTLYDTYGLFLAKALILGESGAELERYLDVPAFPVGDLYYVQKLVWTLANSIPDFSLSVTPTTHAIRAGETAVYTIQLQPGNDFSDNVTLSTNTPGGINISLSNNNVTLPAQVTLTVVDLHNSSFEDTLTYNITITASGGDVTRQRTIKLIINPKYSHLPIIYHQ
ncbi:MAG: PQQ-like beta-propeller repeat protein [Anaerolineales bacterium]|nr:PQQ-like beta-propeller repeat protein [Anaerolineales bacterium]